VTGIKLLTKGFHQEQVKEEIKNLNGLENGCEEGAGGKK